MIVRVSATCHTQHTWDGSICIFLFNRTTVQVFVTYLIGALYVHHLWFYKHQHDNRVRSKSELFVACQRWWFQWRFWFVPSVPGYLREQKKHKPDLWRIPIHILLSHVYCVWQVVKTRQSFWITLYSSILFTIGFGTLFIHSLHKMHKGHVLSSMPLTKFQLHFVLGGLH